jgi:hypothetical protein
MNEINARQVGHDTVTFLPYPEKDSEFNLIISIKYYEVENESDKILAHAQVVGLYNSDVDKSDMFNNTYSKDVYLDRNGLEYEKYFEQNYQNQDIIDNILKELAQVFNEQISNIQEDLVLSASKIMNE